MSSPQPSWMKWASLALTVLPSAMLLFSAVMKLMGGAELEKGFAHLGWPAALAVPLGLLEIGVTVLYLIPRTAVFGAILVTGFLGAAAAAHVRLGEAWLIQVLLGVMAWGGLYLRDARLRELLPLRR